jgi:hypothetical protein
MVGGHALALIGYDLPRNVYVIQNSYGDSWGGYVDSLGTKHTGCFAVDMDFFDKVGHATYQRIDMDESIDELIASYEGKDVKVADKNGLFRIQNGTKCPYPDSVTFFAYGGKYGKWGKTYVGIAQSLLDKIPMGTVMDINQSPYWPFIKDNYPMLSVLSEPKNLEVITKAIQFANDYSTKLKSMAQDVTKKYGVLSSSVDPQSLSMTVKGVLLGIMPVIIMILNLRGIEMDNETVDLIVDTIVNIVFFGGSIVASVMALWGAVRKIYQSYKSK